MERVGEHAVPVGPLAVRWLAYELEEQRAGVRRARACVLENAGSAPWRSRGQEGVQLAYHWLDPLGNPIVWDGLRTAFPDVVPPGRERRARVVGLAPAAAGELPPRVRPRRGVPVLVRGGRIDAARGPGRGAAADRRAAARGRGARPSRRGARGRARRAGGAAGRRTIPSPSPISSLERCRRRTGRGCCSTRTQRAIWPSGRRSPPNRAATDGASPPGLPEAAATRASASRCSSRRCSRASCRRRTWDCPPTGRGRPLRRPRRRQTSTAIRSSERLNTNAPKTSATPRRRACRRCRPRRVPRRRTAPPASPRSAA